MSLDTFDYLIRKLPSRYAQSLKESDSVTLPGAFFIVWRKGVVALHLVGVCLFINHLVRSLQTFVICLFLLFAHLLKNVTCYTLAKPSQTGL